MIAYHSQPDSRVLEIRAEGHINNDEFVAVAEQLKADLASGKDRLIEIIDHFTGMEPAAFMTDLKLAMSVPRKLDRVAVVADRAWIRALSHLGPLFTSAEVRVYEPAQIAEARSWIEA